jgi:UDP-N-acetyl-2-amino-2-deoxyglucuronate dehydrogenase
MDSVRFGVVGCGAAAVPVCAALAESTVASLAVCYDRDPALALDLAGKHQARPAEDFEALLADAGVDAVYIAVPHAHLAPLARRALEAGKHALVEKPMALSVQEAEDLSALAESRGLALGVFYELRYHPALALGRELVQAGAIGAIQAVRIQTLIDKPFSYYEAGYAGRSRSNWRAQRATAGGGVLLMNTSHLLDAAWHLTGLEVERVSAEAGTLAAEVEVEDTAAAVLRYRGGAIGSLLAGAHLAGAATGDERFDLFGSQGQMRLPDPYADGPLRLYLRRPWRGYAAGCWLDVPASNDFGRSPANIYQRAVDDFAQAVQRGVPAPIDGRDARRVLSLVTAMYQSAQAGRAVSIG